MKDEPISVGDLVMVIKPTICCGYGGDMGRPFTVLAIAGAEYGPSTCNQCGQKGRLLKNMHTGKCVCEDCISACVDQIKGSV